MRWTPFFILVYLVFGIQLGLGGIVHNSPNFALLAAIFIAVNAHHDSALGGCLFIGLLADLSSQLAPFGVGMASFALVGMLVISLQEIVYRDHILTHVSLGLICGLFYALLQITHAALYGFIFARMNHKPSPWNAAPLKFLAMQALYTALAAPIALALLKKVKKRFGFRPLRSHRGK